MGMQFKCCGRNVGNGKSLNQFGGNVGKYIYILELSFRIFHYVDDNWADQKMKERMETDTDVTVWSTFSAFSSSSSAESLFSSLCVVNSNVYYCVLWKWLIINDCLRGLIRKNFFYFILPCFEGNTVSIAIIHFSDTIWLYPQNRTQFRRFPLFCSFFPKESSEEKKPL